MLSEAQIHYATEAARVVRCAAYSAARTPEWGNSVVLGVPAFGPNEIVEPVEAALCLVRREPRGELVRVRFDADSDVPLSSDCEAAIRREIAPFIVGVGDVVTEDSAEGFKVFLLDDREVLRGHGEGSEIEVEPAMIEAGATVIWAAADALGARAAWGCDEGRDWAARVFLAMARSRVDASVSQG